MKEDPHLIRNPHFSGDEVKKLAAELYGVSVSEMRPLDSYTDQNFYLKDDKNREFVFKISNHIEEKDVLDMQHKTIEFLSERIEDYRFPGVCTALSGEQISTVKGEKGAEHFVRMLTFLPGTFLSRIQPYTPGLLHDAGYLMGTIDKALAGFTHRAANRYWKFDLKTLRDIIPNLPYIDDHKLRTIVEHFLLQFETFVVPALLDLRTSIIHNDGSENNILIEKNKDGKTKVIGLIDFGDMVYTYTVCEPAVTAAYAILGQEDVIETASNVIGGYHKAYPLTDQELEIILYLIAARLCISVSMAAFRLHKLEPDNEYLKVSSVPARDALEKLMYADPVLVLKTFRSACGLSPLPKITGKKHKKKSSRRDSSPARPGQFMPQGRSVGDIIELRRRFLNPSLSISYRKPLKIVRGLRQYLYDEDGRAYLDCVNNVCHVGHCHPRVVAAASRQLAVLNTNTRYLHDNIVEYAQRLCATLPEPLRVCYFVNSGSEANDLALRLSRTHTGRRDTIVMDHAYHGNLTTLIEISPYKFDGPGGLGALPFIHKVSMPDVFRGPYKAADPEAGVKYAREVSETIAKMAKNGRQPAAFICESLPGVGGQIMLPENYLKNAFEYVREAGGVCIADEVQVGFGRVGTHFWGFDVQGVAPDIVTFGKPIGNGFPLGAVVTTEEIAVSFNNGMEYFNTFGGNPVSCAVGLAVLDVIRDEKLQKNARTVGNLLLAGLKELQRKHPLIGDVRGMGLFIGIELVMDRENLSPAADQAYTIIEKMKNEGILLSVDGPLHNVLKIKPPIVFDERDADFLLTTLDKVLGELSDQ